MLVATKTLTGEKKFSQLSNAKRHELIHNRENSLIDKSSSKNFQIDSVYKEHAKNQEGLMLDNN